MRLLDQVATARKPVIIKPSLKPPIYLPGAGSRAADVIAAPLRYVLDDVAAQQCWGFVFENEGMFDPQNELLRMAATEFWLESSTPGTPAEPLGAHRAGVLIRAADDGRRGCLQSFWEVVGEEPDMAQASLRFDLDQTIAGRADNRATFAISSSVAPSGIARLLDHLLVHVNEAWIDHLSSAGARIYHKAVGQIVRPLWNDLLFSLGFSALLTSKSSAVLRPVNRGRLNPQREARGKPPLLDHMEVTLTLHDPTVAPRPGPGGSTGRGPARLHFVRGHMVRRAGKVFWRAAHLRGHGASTPLTRTVKVRGAAAGARWPPEIEIRPASGAYGPAASAIGRRAASPLR